MNNTSTFYDNIRVVRSHGSNEFLSINLLENENSESIVCLTRYCVPGRITTYYFGLEPIRWSKGIIYYSANWKSMTQSMAMLERDLDRPQVIKMILNAFTAERIMLEYAHQFLHLLQILAPANKIRKLLAKQCNEMMRARAIRMNIDVTKVPSY
jgi:hypothetical protein